MLKRFWCKFAHSRASWPIHGQYYCLQCGTKYRVLWDQRQESPALEETNKRTHGLVLELFGAERTQE